MLVGNHVVGMLGNGPVGCGIFLGLQLWKKEKNNTAEKVIGIVQCE
jgi:hypothetical protein